MAASKTEHPTSEFVEKGLPCPDQAGCGSSDAAALYSDGHLYCFSCAKSFRGDGGEGQAATPKKSKPAEAASKEVLEAIRSASPRSIKSRGLTQATCRDTDYLVRQTPSGEWEQLAVYKGPHGEPLWIKVRNTGKDGTDKRFYTIPSGGIPDTLFLQNKWGNGGRMLTIVGGEVDALTVFQCYAGKYPVVSPPKGEPSAPKAVAKNLEWVNSFDRVNIGLDMDKVGREASIEIAKLLPPGKAYIISWSRKDPNEMHLDGLDEEITRAVWQAKPYRPDGIIDARELTAQCLDPVVTGIPWPWPFMTRWTYGRRNEEVYTIGAGTGIGKTDFIAEVIACTLAGKAKDGEEFAPEGFAVFAYEAGAATTKKAVAGKLWHRRFHIPQDDSGVSWTDAELRAAMDFMDQDCWNRGGKLFINDSKGAADWEAVKERARYLHHSEGILHFLVDPISALVAGIEDERKALDAIVLESANLSVELGCKIYLLSHLTRPKLGPPHEEGGQVQLGQFRGSNGIGMFSNFVFGLERNQQDPDEGERCKTVFRVVKDRFTGNSTGKTAAVVYDVLHGTLDLPTPIMVGDI